jgi:tyrosine-protein phosphatase SIW14
MTRRRSGSAAAPVVALVAVVAVALSFNTAIRRNIFPKNFGVVDEGRVYRAGQLTPAAMRRVHAQYGFKTVIDLGSAEPGTRLDRRNQRTADSLGLLRYRFDLVGDATGNPNAYAQALRIMTDPEHQPVLVHCGAGSERTSCAVILYNNIARQVPLDEGLAGAKNFKHNPRRNPHLGRVLEEWGELIIEAHRTGGPVAGAEPLPEPEAVKSEFSGQ